MATWTQDDIDRLKAAIVALACGEKEQTVQYGGPPARVVTYYQVDLDQMRALLASMQQDVADAPTYRILSTNKGFNR